MLDAFDDCQLLRNEVQNIVARTGLSRCDALKEFYRRFDRLALLVPIGLFVSDKPFGKLYLLKDESRGLNAVFDNEGNVVGPPFLHYSRINEPKAEQKFTDFFEQYGFPDVG